MSAVFVYVTVPTVAEAEKIAAIVVEARLAACGNILPGMKSVYRWEGKIERGEETVLILKTQESLFHRLEERIKELHPYDVPCIVALPVTAGHAPFLAWIDEETG